MSGSELTLIFLCLFWQIFVILASSIPATHPLPDSFAISCGSSGSFSALDGRLWIGDSGLESTASLQINGKPSNSRAIHQLASLASVPYKTARVSRHEFSYVFQVKPGQKFIRLHFHHDSYKGFKRSKPLFTVKAGPYTLLSNFSTALAYDILGEKQSIKEYCVNIDEGLALTITFSPAQSKWKSDDFYAFVNGIEVVSMPTGLYFTPEGELGTLVVGQKYRFYIDNGTALELVQRLNVGGTSISPTEDSRLFRRWDEDSNYLLETGARPANTLTTVKYIDMLAYIAPIKVYQTARTMLSDTELSVNSLTWKIPVHLGFRYLIRLHFSKFEHQRVESTDKDFSVLINNQIVEDNANVIQRGGASGVAVYRDYIVMMDGDQIVGKFYLTITFLPKFESKDNQLHGTLVALEVFKLSNPNNNLAGRGLVPESQHSASTPQHKKSKSSYHTNFIFTVLTIILVLLNIVAHNMRRISDSSSRRNIRSSSLENICRQFSIEEIWLSTNNFDPQFHIGSGGYGRVYKGVIDKGATVVAFKRLKTESRQGEKEFQTEIKMLSKVRHKHVVSLIGYCNDGQERILVYQYITRGTLADHLYKTSPRGRVNPPLPWELRLKVSIGAARGLYYLHSRHRIIHSDVKSSNILLDENWVAKISDFGLSKKGPEDSIAHISTKVQGTFGYLDPEYFLTNRLTRKSDVYSFGVVLFEVLSGRPAVDIRLVEEQHSLAGWVRYSIREGKVNRLVDHNLMEQISPACLKVFVGIAGRCLQTEPQGRPAMADVVMALELALALQQNKDPTEQMEEAEKSGRSYSSDGVVSMDDISLPKGESGRSIGEANPSSSTRIRGNDQKSGKIKAKDSNNNLSQRWWWDPFGIIPRAPSKSKALQLNPPEVIHQFSLPEIQKATNHFHSSHIIGYGGLDNIYKGYIDGGKKSVAIIWSRAAESRVSMAHELQARKEIQMKSSPTQDHVASPIGYCENERDMILIYKYMENGTLYDHLHDATKAPLPWKRRLEICIGAARGLRYIYSKIKQTMLHRDLKSTNIWLDENWIPKVSGWGLSKKKGNNQVPSIMRSNWGIVDSDYIRGDIGVSYVYSFGLILFEVLFAEKESDRWFDEDQVILDQWIKSCMRNNLSDYIDPFLVERAQPDSLRIFIETAERCLHDYDSSVIDLEARLEAALQLQETAEAKGFQLRKS